MHKFYNDVFKIAKQLMLLTKFNYKVYNICDAYSVTKRENSRNAIH